MTSHDKASVAAMAKRLRAYVNGAPADIRSGGFKHSHALEATARMLGAPDYNTLAAGFAGAAQTAADDSLEGRGNAKMRALGASLLKIGDDAAARRAADDLAKLASGGEPVRFRIDSDDGQFTASGDARPWLAQARGCDIEEARQENWGPGRETDAIAEFFRGKPGYEDVTHLFDYLDLHPTMLNFGRDPVGFSCKVDAAKAEVWIAAHWSKEKAEEISARLDAAREAPPEGRDDASFTAHIVQGKHFSVPGVKLSCHATKDGAAKAALGLVNIMLGDLDLARLPDDGDWRKGLSRVKAKCKKEGRDERQADVWIEELVLQP